jgi:nanoRNase/pAp phosphatase (c-di-AMP/oligoRNAs hydrolase)
MNSEFDKTNQILRLIEEAGSIAILPSKTAGIDSFSSAVGLYYMLKDEGKNVSIIYQGAIPEDFGSVDDVEISNSSSSRELLVSVDYSGTSASKVNYSTENDVLHFSISPIDRDFDLSRVKSEIKGFDYDLIITIGAPSRNDLGKLLEDVGGGFGGVDILNIDNSERNQRFGNINVVDPSFDSMSLLVLNHALKWNLVVSSKAAEALLKGISRRKGI